MSVLPAFSREPETRGQRVDVLQFANIALLQRCGRKSCDGHRDGLCAFLSAASRDDDVVERVASSLSRPCRPFLRNSEIRDSQPRRAQTRAAYHLALRSEERRVGKGGGSQ